MKPRRVSPRRRSSLQRRKALPRELNVGEAKARFSQLVNEAARGASFVIAKAGTPIARLVPLEAEPRKFIFGALKGMFSAEEERALLEAIDAPLPDEVLAAFYASPLKWPDQ